MRQYFSKMNRRISQKSLYFVFERINSGGIRLSPQEIRNCINDGPFLNSVRALNEDENWRAAFGDKRNNRLKDQELILRFLAMMQRASKYARPMKDFLNTFTAEFSAPKSDRPPSIRTLIQRRNQTLLGGEGESCFQTQPSVKCRSI